MAGGLAGSIFFRPDLCDRGSMERLALRFEVMTSALGGDTTDVDVRALPMMPLGEGEHVLWTFNDTFASLPKNICINELMEAQAKATSETVALEWQGDSMTCNELMESAVGVAIWLQSNGAKPEGLVALQLHRSLEQVVGMMGVLLSGSAYLPLDPKWPLERRRFITYDANCRQLVSQSVHLIELSWFDGAVLALDDPWLLAYSSVSWVHVKIAVPENIAYIMYTSGSTGRPKGVIVPHIGVSNLLLGARLRYQPHVGAAFGAPTPYVFDVSVYNIFASLVVHCSTCRLLQDGSSLAMLNMNDELTHLSVVPSLLAIARLPPSLKHIEVGGEAMSQRALDNVPSSTCIYNYYGPTEAAIWATRRSVVKINRGQRLASIGRTLPNVACYIVDHTSDLHVPCPQPKGLFGEIWLAGLQISRGYLGRPQKTAEVFVPHPWSETDPLGRGVIYRTGDRARWYTDGEIEFAGRIDFQVKMHGQRMELGEIENKLSSQPGVLEAVVVLLTIDDKSEPTLVAYVHPASTVQKQAEAASNAVPFDRVPALDAMRHMLPTYMLPSLLIGVNDWPRTSSNKIDRKKLPAPISRDVHPHKVPSVPALPPAECVSAYEHGMDQAASKAYTSVPTYNMMESEGQVSMSTEIYAESNLSELVHETLLTTLQMNRVQIKAHAPLMDLGMNSLQAVMLMQSLSDDVGTALPATMCFEFPTIYKLSAAIDRRLRNAAKKTSNDRIDTSSCHSTAAKREDHLLDVKTHLTMHGLSDYIDVFNDEG